MATLNAVFGALASTLVFLLACRSTDRLILSAAVAGLHATAGFVLLNSLNSEDVIPAYTLFVCMTACIWLFLKTGMVPWLATATFFLSLVTFFHWTLFPPAAAGLAVASFLASSTRLASLWLPIVAIGATAAWIQFWLSLAHLASLDAMRVGLLNVLAPSKAALTGWLGFSGNKFVYSLVGMGNYWVGARNVYDYVAFFRVPLNVLEMALSLGALVVAILVCLWTLLSMKSTRPRRAFASFGLAVFFSGELMNLYSQPQDPQFQIQPMFIIFVALLLALEHLTRASWAHRVHAVGLTLLAIALLVGMHHVSRFAILRSQDSVRIRALRDFMVQFPRAQTRIVSHGFEGWNTWLYVFGFEADRESFTQESIMLAGAFTLNYGISAAAAADLMTARIAGALGAGYRVYAGTLWMQDEKTFVGWMSTVAQRERASEFYRLLLARFSASNARETPYGTFVELKER